MMSEEAILRIPLSSPELLFRGGEAEVHRLYRRLAAQWHPDRNASARATEVFQRIAALHGAARKRIASGRWSTGGAQVLLAASDGRGYRIRYLARRPFELGEALIGRTLVSFLVEPDAADLFARAVAMLRAPEFACDGMRREIEPCLGHIRAVLEGADRAALVLEKPADMVLLADLAAHMGGTVPAAHTAWILSSLYNLACWLQWARIAHNAIGPQTVFVSPERHTVALLGGWWYAASVGERLSALPARTAQCVPGDIVRAKTADLRCDLELIRATGRELLGDASGARLVRDGSIPRALANWLRHPSSGCAATDYGLWREVIVASFGARRFSRLDVAPEEIYPPTH